MKIAAALAAFATAFLAGAQEGDWGDAKDELSLSPEYERSKAFCRAVREREPPASDGPTPQQRLVLKGCDSEALYYGIGMKADPEKARLCAFIEAEGEDEEGGSPFSGRTMLMTIYANGVGAKRDLDVATHIACQVSWAPAESHGRVMHLAEMKASRSPDSDFHYCQDVTSGYAAGFCAGHGARIAEAERRAELAALTRGWTAPERAALARLEAAHDAFSEAHADGEVDATGTWRNVFWTSAREQLEDELLAMLKQLAAGSAPKGDAAAFRAADAKLNAAYRKVLRETEPVEAPGAVTRQGIREAQRAWIRYRDAFLAFAAVKFPGVKREGLAAWITDKRTGMLNPAEN